MIEKNSFYLAHPLLSSDYIRKWQVKMESKYDIKMINPFFEGTPVEVKLAKRMAQSKEKIPLRLTSEENEKIVMNDLGIIEETIGTIGIIDGNTSYGTIMEIFYARRIGKPVYLVVTNGYEHHCWLQYVAFKTFTSLSELEEHFKEFYFK